MLLTLVFLFGLFGAIGLATDSGHVLVNKTRLQNALDAAALSAAIAVNGDPAHNTANATTAGKATFDLFKGTTGNSELSGISANSLTFQYSKYLTPFTPGTAPPSFVRVSTNALPVAPILIQVVGGGTVNVGAQATAGILGQNCNLVPLVICPTAGMPTGCNATGCNGIPFNTRFCLKGGTAAAKTETCQDTSIPNGNFGLLRFDGMSGGNDIKNLLSGAVNTCANTATWENGNKVGPVSQGIEGRFDGDKVNTEYFPSPGYVPGQQSNLYQQYDNRYKQNPPSWDNPNGKEKYRVVQVPVVNDCNSSTVTITASTCLFMSQQATHTGTSNEIYGELLSTCNAPGVVSPTNSVIFGPTKVVLFKTAGSQDS